MKNKKIIFSLLSLLLYANRGPMEALRIVWINADAAFFAVLSD